MAAVFHEGYAYRKNGEKGARQMASDPLLTLSEKAKSIVGRPLLNAHTLPSPALVFYEEGIQQNIDAAVRTAGAASRLRPHIKTHKTAEIIEMAMRSGITKFKCSTIAEAELLARTGAPDVLIAYPLIGRNAERLAELAAVFTDTRFSVLADSAESVRWMNACAEKHWAKGSAAKTGHLPIGIFFDIDVGQHRTGFTRPEDAAAAGAYLSSCRHLHPAGLHCYDGHNRQQDLDERNAAVRGSINIMESFRSLLERSGIELPEIIMGGTPTFPCYAGADDEFILSPGTFFLFDYRYSTLFPDLPFTPAAVIIAHVISRNAERNTFTIDLGSKGISTDQQDVRGVILNIEGAQPLFQSEEHWVFTLNSADGTHTADPAVSADGGKLPDIGDAVYVIPAHICTAVHLYERAYIAESVQAGNENRDIYAGRWTKTWKIAARDRVITF